tara:strand:+ start:157 stop:555 length:399 start_codon:yes stop_codon:yes gene_type:complete
MKSRLEKVYSKLPNQKVNLKKQRVSLSMKNDIDSRSKDLSKNMQVLGDIESKYFNLKNEIENKEADLIVLEEELKNQVLEIEADLNNQYQEVERAISISEELGVESGEFFVYESQSRDIEEEIVNIRNKMYD